MGQACCTCCIECVTGQNIEDLKNGSNGTVGCTIKDDQGNYITPNSLHLRVYGDFDYKYVDVQLNLSDDWVYVHKALRAHMRIDDSVRIAVYRDDESEAEMLDGTTWAENNLPDKNYWSVTGTTSGQDFLLERKGGKALEEELGSRMDFVVIPSIKVYNVDLSAPITLRCVGNAGFLKHTELSEVAVKGAQRILATLKEACHISDENIYVCRVRIPKRTAYQEVVTEEEAEPEIEAERLIDCLRMYDFMGTFDDYELKDGDTIGIYSYTFISPEEKEAEEERKRVANLNLSPLDQGVPDLTVPYFVTSSLLMHPDLF